MPTDEPTQSWYASESQPDGVRLLTERYVHPWARCNIWLVRGRDRDLLIDSGSGLMPLTPSLALAHDRPVVAVATHGHFDHVGALHEFADRRAHLAEAPDYAAMPDRLTLAPLFRAMADPVSALPRPDWRAEDYTVAPAAVTSLNEGDRIDLGDRTLSVLHLPGHSPGSIGLYEERTGILFSGDALYDGELIDDFPTSDIPAYLATMARLRELSVSTVHGGHGPSFGPHRKAELVDAYVNGRRARGCAHAHGD